MMDFILKNYRALPMKNLILFFCVLVNGVAVAQDNDKVIARVFYTMQHKRDTSNRDSVYKENMVLSVSTKASLFSSFDKVAQSEKIKKQEQEQTKNWTGDGPPGHKFSGLRKLYNEDIYHFLTERKRIVKEFLIRNYLYEQPLEDVNWILTAESKLVGKFNAQKATTWFKGRQWIAWFAADLPFETGPWKLQGLPGLIVEAYDERREIEFIFNGFESVDKAISHANPLQASQKDDIIELPKKVNKINESELLKLKASMYKDPKGFYNAQLTTTGGFPDNADDMLGLSYKKINNPIELPVKKQ